MPGYDKKITLIQSKTNKLYGTNNNQVFHFLLNMNWLCRKLSVIFVALLFMQLYEANYYTIVCLLLRGVHNGHTLYRG